MANFIFHANEEKADDEVELPHLHIGGVVREVEDTALEPIDKKKEEKLLLLEYLQGLEGELQKTDKEEVGPSFVPHDDDVESDNAIPEVEINNLGTIVIFGEEYVFLHDLEKALELRMDECLALFCTKTEFPLNNSDDHLAVTLLPLGDSVQTIVALGNECTEQSEQANVNEAEFLKVQEALLLAEQTPISADVTGVVDYPLVVEEEKSLVNLEGVAEQDNKQEDVLEVDNWALCEGGKQTSLGSSSPLHWQAPYRRHGHSRQ